MSETQAKAKIRRRLPRPRVESVLAAGAGLVGVLALASALTPDLADRAQLVNTILPTGFPELARVLALAFGLALLLLSRSLARGRRRAWTLALLAVIGVTIAHLAKGLDFEESMVSLLLVVALLRYRSHFDAPGNPAARRPVAGALLAVAAMVAIGVVFSTHGMPNRVGDLISAIAVLLSLGALVLWLGPFPEHVSQSLEERHRARELVESFGRDSLVFFTLRRDKSLFFSPSGNSFLAYRLVGSSALISGDPVGRESEFASLVADFVTRARDNGWRVAVVGADQERLGLYREQGLGRAVKIGDEAFIRPEQFSTEGRTIRKVRQSAHKVAERDGIRFRVVRAKDADQELRLTIEQISLAWLAGRRERGFSMAMDDLFAPGSVLALALDCGDDPIAFLHLVPSPAGGGYSLSTQRRLPGCPGGISEFLIVETLAWAREARIPELSLNFCAFRSLLEIDEEGRLLHRLARRTLLGLDSIFQLERLSSFSHKFRPEWRPRYVCLERLSDLPAVGLAYLRAESLIASPQLAQPQAAAETRLAAAAPSRPRRASCQTSDMAKQPGASSFGRLSEIAQVAVRHGFGYLLARHHLGDLIPGRRKLRLEEPVASERGRHLREMLEELGPTFVKFGQLLSMRPDLLPPEVISELRPLQDDVKALRSRRRSPRDPGGF